MRSYRSPFVEGSRVAEMDESIISIDQEVKKKAKGSKSRENKSRKKRRRTRESAA